jgi:hypothetical protein
MSKDVWTESYNPCGCSSEAPTRKDLLGYCATHGDEWRERISPTGNVTRKVEPRHTKAKGSKGVK